MHHLVIALLLLSYRIVATAETPSPYIAEKLSNGMELVYLEVHKVPLVTIVLTVKAGAMTETPATNGLTHLWEHMFFKGNKRIPNQEAFNKRIRQLGIVYNGDTSAEKVRYYFTLPSAYLDEGLQFMADAISSPLIEQSELEKERRVVLNEYERSAAYPGFDFSNLERALLYGQKNYLRDPLGKRPEILAASREQLLKIKDEVFVPSNSALLIAGDFNPSTLKSLVNKHFSEWKDPPEWKPPTQVQFPPLTQSTSFVMLRPNVENATIQISFVGPKVQHDTFDTYSADVLINLLSHKSGRFHKKFEDSGLAFEAGLSYPTQAHAGEITLYAATKPEDAQLVERMLRAEVEEWLRPDYFSLDQLDDVRRNLIIRNKRELNQPSEYIKTMGFWWAITGLEYYENYIPNLKKITLADIRTFISKWIIKKPYISGILLSPEDAAPLGLKDTSTALVDRLLSDYRRSDTPASQQKSTKPNLPKNTKG